ncbi:ABC transporter permease [Mongoliitalea daihaiensis]|uniref:ABC transporter permease n=1 Tax=Mongoliitalea daihaiensis TaxID=2782006 RepID=UPI001F193780|nr:ABC transporter permease [Mongoliitalea daihaiensis]UJP65596.1 ABC transporter permease [Mongoliitalea daihaiensis]
MDKIWLIIQREYLSRVQKKSFLLATLLTPLIFPAIIGLFLWIALGDMDKPSLRIIEVVDENNLFFIESSDQYAFSFSKSSLDDAKLMVQNGERYGLLHIPPIDLSKPTGFVFYSMQSPSVGIISFVEASLKRRIEEQRLYEAGIDPKVLETYRTKVSIQNITLDSKGEEKISSATVNYVIGFIAGILIYLFIFLYGNQIMQGVIEEKSSRIVEILISSLKPFQLMMGKIVGIGAVGLTQFAIWVILISGLTSIVTGIFGQKMPQQQLMEIQIEGSGQALESSNEFLEVIQIIQGIDFVSIILLFTFYFIAGYLLYGAFFAAIGAAVDSPSEAQQFVFPITIPLIISYMGLFVFVLNDPDSQVSFWLSIIPLTSPIAMMGRVSFGVPWWELLTSMSLLIMGFISTAWLAGKIYRIGILTHGTKVNYRTLWKWLSSAQ